MFLKLLSYLPFLRQRALVYLGENDITAINLKSGKSAVIWRTGLHPRSLVGEFSVLDRELGQALANVFRRQWMRSELVICVAGLDEGGYTSLERSAFWNLGQSVRAKRVLVFDVKVDTELALSLLRNELERKTLKP